MLKNIEIFMRNKQEKRQAEYHGNQYDKQNGLTVNLPQVQNDKLRNPTTDKKLSDIAGVSEKTYRMGAKILDSDNEEVKQAVLSGDMIPELQDWVETGILAPTTAIAITHMNVLYKEYLFSHKQILIMLLGIHII